ncbi:MAG: alkane 1-monooxygenase [Bacteroidota bacterium]|nr:alkane 1-monooxygenase [Candidatus Kapabacteria bacterium]MDW8221259.1 alkane 1-monooxygenase [Bacteroidota bacterium]
MSALPYFGVFFFHCCVVLGYMLGGFWNFLTPLVVFGIVPLLDMVIGRDSRNYSAEEYEQLEQRFSFRSVTLLYTGVQLAMIIWGAYVIGVQPKPLAWWEITALTLSIGILSGNGINIAHELLHKPTRFEQFCGKLLLLSVSYMHFYIEHVRGHHVRVATPEDPASARRGESFYAFFPRTLLGSWKSAWELELDRLAKRKIPFFHWRNQMLWFTILPLLAALALGLAFGWLAVAFYALQSFIAIQELEMINYVEHYGLSRRKLPNGRYEPPLPIHSWEAREALTNALLIKLQRHADHHVHPTRRYQTLRVFDESPQMPTGYPGMMLLSLIPPLFFRIMHPILDEHERRIAEQR